MIYDAVSSIELVIINIFFNSIDFASIPSVVVSKLPVFYCSKSFKTLTYWKFTNKNFYKCLCLLRSFLVSLTDFSEPPVITRFCNVMQLTLFIDLHSLRTVLTVSDQISPFTQTGLLCN